MNYDHFRRCWLTLKASSPRLRKKMDAIECAVEGIRVTETKPLPKKDTSNEREIERI